MRLSEHFHRAFTFRDCLRQSFAAGFTTNLTFHCSVWFSDATHTFWQTLE